jgi:hypothetical protein
MHPALSAALKARYNLTRWCFGGEDEISISATELHALNKQLANRVWQRVAVGDALWVGQQD